MWPRVRRPIYVRKLAVKLKIHLLQERAELLSFQAAAGSGNINGTRGILERRNVNPSGENAQHVNVNADFYIGPYPFTGH
jgi:hypothetical protein